MQGTHLAAEPRPIWETWARVWDCGWKCVWRQNTEDSHLFGTGCFRDQVLTYRFSDSCPEVHDTSLEICG